MNGWSVDFSPDMIDGTRNIVINCRNEDDASDCAEVLEELGVRYGNKEPATKEIRERSRDYKENFCFYIEGFRLYYGPIHSTNDHPWNRYEKCTFNGVDIPDISDDSFSDIIGGDE